MQANWKVQQQPLEKIENLRRATGIPEVLLKILWNRGIQDEIAISHFLEPKIRYLSSPFLLKDIFKAIRRIKRAINNNEFIRIYGDRDVDGITAVVVLLEAIKSMYQNVDFTVPVIEEGYGLNIDFIDNAKKEGVSLIITVDCGICNHFEIEYAKKLGIDVIITDHHEPPAVLPKAEAIINPKIPGNPDQSKEIAGVGVAYKLAMAILLANSKELKQPIYAFDFNNNEIDVVKFSIDDGFKVVKSSELVDLSNKKVVFYNKYERLVLQELCSELESLTHNYNVIYVEDAIKNAYPDIQSFSKDTISNEISIPNNCFGAEKNILLYLKALEALNQQIKNLLQRSLDVLAVGTIADMVPLKGENRTISQIGLKFITNTKRCGLQELYTILGWKNKQMTERDISYYIAPILNSSGRLKTAELAINLLTTTDRFEAENLARELFQLNIERKKLADEYYKSIKEYLLQQNNIHKDKMLVVHAPLPNQGVTGIVATKLMLDFCRPVIVLLEDHDKYMGSARSCKSINLITILNSCSSILEKYGGHVGAAGLTLAKSNLNVFIDKIKSFANNYIPDDNLQKEFIIDTTISIDEVDEQLFENILKFAPFGVDNPQPLFLAQNAEFTEIRKVGESKNHLRFKLRKSSGKTITGIGFNLAEKINGMEALYNGYCDLVFTIEANEYNGTKSLQIMVYDVNVSKFAKVE